MLRRDFLQFSLSVAFGLGELGNAPRLLAGAPERRFKPVIVLFLAGGPSRQETFDPCLPDDPIEFRGQLGRVETSIRGVYYSEVFPRMAARADKCAVLRGLDSESSDHFQSGRNLLLGTERRTVGIRWGEKSANGGPPYLFVKVPSFYPVMDCIQLPEALEGRWQRTGDAEGVFATEWARDLASPGRFVGPALRADPRLNERAELLAAFDTATISSPAVERRDANYRLALSLLRGGGGSFFEAFTPPAREQRSYEADLARYGDSILGKGLLLAKRLTLRGAGFTVVYNERGMGWDAHSNLFDQYRTLAAEVDRAAAALIDDITGGVVECLFIIVGEFGRTPRVNSSGGRDHWAEGYPAIFCGPKVRKGVVHGRTHKTGRILDGRVPAKDFAPTLIHLAGGEEFLERNTPRVREIIA